MECDFCSAQRNNYVRFRAVSFVSHADEKVIKNAPVKQVSEGDWAACSQCAVLIFADRWEELAVRSADEFERKHGALPERERFLAYLRALHQEFKENRL